MKIVPDPSGAVQKSEKTASNKTEINAEINAEIKTEIKVEIIRKQNSQRQM